MILKRCRLAEVEETRREENDAECRSPGLGEAELHAKDQAR
jgi:hypothetical protein